MASLDHTPTWAMGVTLFFFVSASLLLLRLVELLGRWLTRRGKKSFHDALQRIKGEVMVLGFISLLLEVVQKPIPKICVPTRVAHTMLPCRRKVDETATDATADHCTSRGKVSLMSEDGIHQLHILIFVLGVVHILCSVLTMALGNLKMRQWKAWEMDTQTFDYEVANDPRRFRLTRETTYARRHVNYWTETSILRWTAHFPTLRAFNFQKYIERSLEEDFKTVLQMSPTMWFLVVIFLLLDVYEWYSHFWLSLLPLTAVLASGTKLHSIVAKMAIQVSEDAVVVSGQPTVRPSDDLFWFGRPKLVLFLIHFTLFQNAFQLSFFLWVWYEYGLGSCYLDKTAFVATRVSLAVVVQIICSYVTLPLYALVTRMGSKFNRSMYEKRTAKALTEWHEEVRKKIRNRTVPISE